MPKTLFVVNPRAGNGRGARIWQRTQEMLHRDTDTYAIVITQVADDVLAVIDHAYQEGIERVISIGGDGTANSMVNALMQMKQSHDDYDLVYGNIPAGTGRDGARGLGIPLGTDDAIRYILYDAAPQPVDIGRVRFGDTVRYFFNVSSAGVSNRVVQYAAAVGSYPWTFLYASVRGLLAYQPEQMQIELDGAPWFEGDIYIASVANGQYFGQGLHIAPDARNDDGLFDIVVVENMSLLNLARKFPSLYSGAHIHYDEVHTARARQVHICSVHNAIIPIDFDGEPAVGGRNVRYDILPRALMFLM